mgnify:CR=1 FL=1
MFPSLPQPRHMPCPECGESVALESRERHACDEERQVTYRLSDDRVFDLLGLAESLLSDVARGVYECTRYENS